MQRILRLVAFIFDIISSIQYKIMSAITFKKPTPILPITDPLMTLSATVLAKKIRQREITCYELVHMYIKRINYLDSDLNAVIDKRYHLAIKEAKLYDEALSKGTIDVKTLEKEKPLYGVPITIKESCSVKDLSFTNCTLAKRGVKATENGAVVQTLQDAGAILLCVTNTPEMCCSMESTNLLYGRTCNPYDIRYSAGGSSGGEGALLGAGCSLIGCGSDLCGSIRIPALFNGIFGYKPTSGLLSNKGHSPECEDKNFQRLLTLGPMCRYAEDLKLMMKVLTAKCNYNLRLDEPVDTKRLKIYYQATSDKTFGMSSVSPDLLQCIKTSVEYFAKHGTYTEELPIKVLDSIMEIVMAMFLNFNPSPPLLLNKDPKVKDNVLVELLKFFFGQRKYTLPVLLCTIAQEFHILMTKSDILYYTQQAELLRQKLMKLLKEDGVLICLPFKNPTCFPCQIPFEYFNMMYTGIFNVLDFPAVHVPMGINEEGLPIGVQVVAAPYQDRLCLAIAKELEEAFGGWIPPWTVTCQ